MSKLLAIPRWGIMSLIILTVILSFIILARIWFPDLFPEDLFEKIFWTYIVLIFSSAVISRMSEYLKKMDIKAEDKTES